MSTRLFTRIVLGLPLDGKDLDDLTEIAPELLHSDLPPHASLPFPFPFWAVLLDDRDFAELRSRWQNAIRDARERVSRRSEQARATPTAGEVHKECPNPECPMQKQPTSSEKLSGRQGQKDDQPSTSVAYPIHLVQVPGENTPPKSMFMNMTTHLRGRLKGTVKRVIVTDPYVHCDNAEDGTPGGHDALQGFLRALGLEEDSPFTLELTPAPKGGTDGQPLGSTPLGRKLSKSFPQITLKHHRPSKGGFHDRFYLAVDSNGHWDGLYGPSINGLASLAVVLVGDLREDGPARRSLKRLLD